MKSGRTQVELIALYEELGSYRAVGALMGCDHKTVKRYVEAAGKAGRLAPVLTRSRVTDDVAGLIAERVEQTGGRVTARRLMRLARAAGYGGSERSLRRAVAAAKDAWRAKEALEGRVFRPWVSEPGEWLLCDWGAAGTVETAAGPRKLSFFSAVLGWSRYRTVSFSCSERFGALAVGLAHSFEAIGGVPGRVLFDNPKTVATGHLAGVAVLNPDLVRLAAHYRFSPRTTERSDPESKGKVEALVRFTKSDLIPYEGFVSLDQANRAAVDWCSEVNGELHYETRARPAERLEVERPLFRVLPAQRPAVACGEKRKVDRLATVRFASARYSVPHRLVGQTVQVQASDRDVVIMHQGVPVAQHELLAPGEASISDAHYPSPAPTGVRALRPRTPSEHAFLALGPEAEDYLRSAAAAGTARLHERLDEALSLARTRGGDQTRAALARATVFSRFAHGDLGSIADSKIGAEAAPTEWLADKNCSNCSSAAPKVLPRRPSRARPGGFARSTRTRASSSVRLLLWTIAEEVDHGGHWSRSRAVRRAKFRAGSRIGAIRPRPLATTPTRSGNRSGVRACNCPNRAATKVSAPSRGDVTMRTWPGS